MRGMGLCKLLQCYNSGFSLVALFFRIIAPCLVASVLLVLFMWVSVFSQDTRTMYGGGAYGAGD